MSGFGFRQNENGWKFGFFNSGEMKGICHKNIKGNESYGEVSNGVLDGYVKDHFSTGNTYIGQYKDGKRTG